MRFKYLAMIIFVALLPSCKKSHQGNAAALRIGILHMDSFRGVKLLYDGSVYEVNRDVESRIDKVSIDLARVNTLAATFSDMHGYYCELNGHESASAIFFQRGTNPPLILQQVAIKNLSKFIEYINTEINGKSMALMDLCAYLHTTEKNGGPKYIADEELMSLLKHN